MSVWPQGPRSLEGLMSAWGPLASEQGTAVPKTESGFCDGEGIFCDKVGYYHFTFKVLRMIQSNWITGA